MFPRVPDEVRKRLAKLDPHLFFAWDEDKEQWALWTRGPLDGRPPRTVFECWQRLQWDSTCALKMQGLPYPLNPAIVSLIGEIKAYNDLRTWRQMKADVEAKEARERKATTDRFEDWHKDRTDYYKPFLKKAAADMYPGPMPAYDKADPGPIGPVATQEVKT